jgi:hypothetical protein
MTTTDPPSAAGSAAGPAAGPAGSLSRERGDFEPAAVAARRKGVFDPRRVRFCSFVVIALGLFVTATFCVLAIWDYATRDTAWRAVATLGVVAGTMFTFTAINEMFGKRIDG